MKNQEFRGRWLALLFCCLLLSSQGASAAEINLADYEVYSADLTDNGYPDYYFFGKPRVLILHGDLSLPVVYAQADSFVIYQASNGYGQAVPLTLNRTQMAAAGLTQSEHSDAFHQSILDVSSSSSSSSSSSVQNSSAGSTISSSSSQGSSVSNSSSASSTGQSITTDYIYDAMGRLRVVKQNSVLKESYQYDQAGNRCRVSSMQELEESHCPDDTGGGVGSSSSFAQASSAASSSSSSVNNSYTSTWNYGTNPVTASYHNNGGAFKLYWSNPTNLGGLQFLTEFRFRHRLPNGSISHISIGMTHERNMSGLALGLHKFEIIACGLAYYDDDEYEVIECTSWMGIDITVF